MPVLLRNQFDLYIAATLTVENDPSGLHITESGLLNTPTLNYAPTPAAVPTQGVTTGYHAFPFSAALSSGSQSAGIVCMQSQRSLTPGGGGLGYALSYHPVNGEFTLLKLTNGLRTSPTVLKTRTALGLATLGLLWILSPLHDWVLLRAFGGAGELLRAQDFDSPYITTVTEGGFYDDGGSGNPFDVTFFSCVMRGPP